MMRQPIQILFLSLLLLAGLGAGAMAQTSIKVVVNEQAITSYDIAQRARLITLTQRKSGETARRMAQEELVDDVLKLKEAQRIGISVSKGDVDDAFASIAQRVKMSPANLAAALRQSGVDPDTLRARLRAEVAWSRAVGQRFRAQVKVSDSDVIAALQKSEDKNKNLSIEFELRQVIFVVPQKASSGLKAQRKREADQFRKEFTSCETGAAQARTLNEVVVRAIGHRLETELPPALRDTIVKTEVGRLTPPEQTSRGLEMIAVCGKREIQSDIAARTAIEDELRQKEGEQMSRRYLQELRRRATIEYR
ncbi:peptidylprolyl isomerase, partial [Polymorphum gilvum]|uniref:SurA N-terminal domain family protein n=1 Tax=Polymorphum gilvum (strain LMG 25793 / CGMCC 1.9160 / SL003B-26A1) TaxID=991905 RepID=F2J1M0_POLGS